jgi:hypothetical protein
VNVVEANHLGSGPWHWNEDQLKPTFSPSVHIHEIKDPNGKVTQPNCHFFVRTGKLDYCPDSNHHLAGQSVPMRPEDF